MQIYNKQINKNDNKPEVLGKKQLREQERVKPRPPISPENESSMDQKEVDAEEDEIFSWLTISEPNPVLTRIIKYIQVGQEFALPVMTNGKLDFGLPPEYQLHLCI